MKKILSVIALIFCVVLVFSFAACQKEELEAGSGGKVYEPGNAVALWEKINTAMDSLESYEMDSAAKVIYYYMGYEMELTATGNAITTSDTHYETAETAVACSELEMSQTIKLVHAYCHGKMYMANNDGTYDQKFCSEMTPAEYEKVKTGDLTEDIDVTDCTRSVFLKNEDGGWTLELSGYTKKTIDKILAGLDLAHDQLGAPIEDMRVVLLADEDFYAHRIELSMVFTETEGEPMPEFSVITEYSGFNETVFDEALLNAEEYTEVEDVRILENVGEALKKRQTATSGRFTLEIKSAAKLMGHTETSTEKDAVSYGEENGAYYYDISAELNGHSFEMEYKNGMQTVRSDGQTHTAQQAEREAKAFIDGLIDSAKYDPRTVAAIEKKDEGVYLFNVVQADASIYDNYFAEIEVELTSAAQQIVVTFEAERLVKIESKITLDGAYRYDAGTAPISTVIESVVTFEEKSQMV